mgnify:FL=1
MRVLVVDDEPAARAKLRRLLAAHADVAVVEEAADAPAALGLAGHFDLAILDIEMPGSSGLQLAEALRLRGLRCLIFSTAHTEHALQAFELGALDYLHKPYLPERLATALKRVREQLALPALQPSLAAPPGEWWVEHREQRLRIRLSEVQWVSAADNYLALHLPPQQYLERGTLAAALERPAWAGLFLRVHRSHAVNPQHVMQCQPLPSGEAVLTMRCGQELRVSRAHRSLLQQLAPAR